MKMKSVSYLGISLLINRNTQTWEMKHWVNNREPGIRIPESWFCSADNSGDTKTMVFKMAAE